MQQGKLFVVSGPSGAGKSVITRALTSGDDFDLSVSMTTRKPREGETEGVSYYFVSHEDFERTVQEDGFLEHASIYGNCYGTPKAPVLEKLGAGRNVVLEIEMQGAMQVKKAYPEAVLIFVLPPSMKVLRERLRGRGTESEEQLNTRMQKALSEIRLLKDYDYYLVNDDLDEAIAEAGRIAKGERRRLTKAKAKSIVSKYEEEENAFISGDRPA
jgi:guanylate kinase